jgi:hypothetical protein
MWLSFYLLEIILVKPIRYEDYWRGTQDPLSLFGVTLHIDLIQVN